jgi:hypothetical protein
MYPGPRLARPSAAIDSLCSSFFPLATLILCPYAEANQFGYYAFRVIASFAILVAMQPRFTAISLPWSTASGAHKSGFHLIAGSLAMAETCYVKAAE